METRLAKRKRIQDKGGGVGSETLSANKRSPAEKDLPVTKESKPQPKKKKKRTEIPTATPVAGGEENPDQQVAQPSQPGSPHTAELAGSWGNRQSEEPQGEPEPGRSMTGRGRNRFDEGFGSDDHVRLLQICSIFWIISCFVRVFTCMQ